MFDTIIITNVETADNMIKISVCVNRIIHYSIQRCNLIIKHYMINDDINPSITSIQ